MINIRYTRRLAVSIVVLAGLVWLEVWTQGRFLMNDGWGTPFASGTYWRLCIGDGAYGVQVEKPGHTLTISGNPQQLFGTVTLDHWDRYGMQYEHYQGAIFERTPMGESVVDVSGDVRAWYASQWFLILPAALWLAFVLYKFSKNWLSWRASRRGLCCGCGYDLREPRTPGSRCPECGREVPHHS